MIDSESATPRADSVAGDAYAQLISDQLEEERDTKDSLEQRGVAVIITSGTLAAIVFGLATALGTTHESIMRVDVRWLLAGALICFLLACAGGVVTNWVYSHKEVDEDALSMLINETRWNGPFSKGARETARARIGILTSAAERNEFKALALRCALIAEVLAILCIGVAAVRIVGIP